MTRRRYPRGPAPATAHCELARAGGTDGTGHFRQLLADRWATAQRTTRDVDQSGVRLRCYLDLRQPIGPAATAAGALPQVSAGGPR
ncbi:DUF6207 family protein [Streptomyces mirabilis]|uniref:DUF6207 family protein n=1 Tax=Streptomyces mirabilis TaxID=68239 RepID=UPI0036DB925E